MKTLELGTQLNVLQAVQAKLTVLLGAGPEKIGIDETRRRQIDQYSKIVGESRYESQERMYVI